MKETALYKAIKFLLSKKGKRILKKRIEEYGERLKGVNNGKDSK